jgi:hypothetical protein
MLRIGDVTVPGTHEEDVEVGAVEEEAHHVEGTVEMRNLGRVRMTKVNRIPTKDAPSGADDATGDHPEEGAVHLGGAAVGEGVGVLPVMEKNYRMMTRSRPAGEVILVVEADSQGTTAATTALDATMDLPLVRTTTMRVGTKKVASEERKVAVAHTTSVADANPARKRVKGREAQERGRKNPQVNLRKKEVPPLKKMLEEISLQ